MLPRITIYTELTNAEAYLTQKDVELENLLENQTSAIRCSSPLCVDPVSGVYTGEEYHEKSNEAHGNTRNTADKVTETTDEKTKQKCVVINCGSKEWF